ncbi:MAG: LysR family transcriptional regulator [Deltaproteobacteria bacterium]|nr:LysR family transcriptional regulator [Deltaproteobacteria bacterium]
MPSDMRFDLNLKQLKVFYFVATHLSFTRAARELFITQPAVTKQIEALEQHCETRLFLRQKSRLALTEAGSVLYSYAERIMRLAFEAEQAVSNLSRNPHGVLRLGTTKTFARYLMPPYILRFHEAFPRIRIQLDEGSSQEMVASVVHGRNDVAVVGRIPYDESVESVPFPGHEADQLVLAVPPCHRLANREEVALEEIRDDPLLLREKGSGLRRLILERLEQKGIKPNILLEAGNADFIKDLIERGAGIGIMGMMSIADDVGRGALAAVPIASEDLVIYIDVVLPREGYRPLAVGSFLEFLFGGA